MKILLIFMAIAELFKFIGKVVSAAIPSFPKKKAPTEPIRRKWYGNCENCGILSGLHRLDGKRYCAKCYARIKTKRDT